MTVVLVGLTAILCVAAPSYASNAADAFAKIAKRDAALARSQLDFRIKVPHTLPGGFRLVHVSWIAPSSVGLSWQRDKDNAYVHAWETSRTRDELGTKGTSLPIPTAMTKAGTPWIRTVGGLCTERHACFTRQFRDGVIVQVDGMPSEQALARVAQGLR